MTEGTEGYLCESGDTARLAQSFMAVFAMKEKAEAMGCAARDHAWMTHDPEKNLRDLMDIYEAIR